MNKYENNDLLFENFEKQNSLNKAFIQAFLSSIQPEICADTKVFLYEGQYVFDDFTVIFSYKGINCLAHKFSTSCLVADAERIKGYIIKLASNARTAYDNVIRQFICATGNKRTVYMGDKIGVLWTTSNIGANTPYERGNLFAWGEISSKASFSRENYSPIQHLNDCLTPKCDIATCVYGKSYSVPDSTDVSNLIRYSLYTWVENFLGSGVNGGLFVSKQNGNAIFFPAEGITYGDTTYGKNAQGNYMCCDKLDCSMIGPTSFFFSKKSVDWNEESSLYSGYTVRAVKHWSSRSPKHAKRCLNLSDYKRIIKYQKILG